MPSVTVETNPTLSALFVAECEDSREFIASAVAPMARVPSESFRYMRLDDSVLYQDEGDDGIAYGSDAKQLSFAASLVDASCDWRGYEAAVDIAQQADFNAADNDQFIDLAAAKLMQLTRAIMYQQELRTANVVTKAANYAAALRMSITSDSLTTASDAGDNTLTRNIKDKIKDCLVAPNTFVTSKDCWFQIAHSPDLINAVKGDTSARGAITQEEFAMLFGIDRVLIGGAFKRTAGGSASTDFLWGSYGSGNWLGSFIRVDAGNGMITPDGATPPSFMVRAESHQREVVEWYAPNRGPRGSNMIKPIACTKELHLSTRAGVRLQIS